MGNVYYAIVTSYLAPTAYKGGRIVAKLKTKKQIFDWRAQQGVEENHRLAAQTFAASLGWKERLIGGELPDGSRCWVKAEE